MLLPTVAMLSFLPYCRVLEADALAPLVRLRELRLEDNAIRSLCITPAAAAAVPSSPSLVAVAGDGSSSSLGGLLPSLCVLQLAGNRLMDMAELDRLALLPGLLEVALAGNPLSRKQVGSVIICLVADTVLHGARPT